MRAPFTAMLRLRNRLLSYKRVIGVQQDDLDTDEVAMIASSHGEIQSMPIDCFSHRVIAEVEHLSSHCRP
jgi:hypothetical protein